MPGPVDRASGGLRPDGLPLLATLLAVMALFGWVTHAVITRAGGDYLEHIQVAERMARTGTVGHPHFAYEAATIAATWLVPGITFVRAAYLVVMLAYLALALILYGVLRRALADAPPRPRAWLAAGGTVALMLVSAVTLLGWKDGHLYFGYLAITVYHNPTMVLLKPLALAVQLCVVRAFLPSRPARSRALPLGCAGLVVLSALAKPNYLIALLPAVFILAAVRWRRGAAIDWPLLLLGVVGPAVAVLAWQYALAFGSPETAPRPRRIVWAPFVVLGMVWTPSGVIEAGSSLLLPKFLLSIVFPLTVCALYWRRARADVALGAAWLLFAAGAGFTYLLAEAHVPSGQIDSAGNFAWSGQIGAFILFVASAAFFLRENAAVLGGGVPPGGRARLAAGALAFGLHLACGALWYARHVVATRWAEQWW